jgi:hypothetical protein
LDTAACLFKKEREQDLIILLLENNKKKRRLFTAGHGSRKRSVVDSMPKNNRPITAKAPGLGRINRNNIKASSPVDGNFRPETVPFTNIGPLGETEPADENNPILVYIIKIIALKIIKISSLIN